MPNREANPAKQKRSAFGLELEAGARDILAHLKGEKALLARPIVLPDEVNAKRIRTAAGMSQADFARAFHIELRTLQDWEQGRRKPDATTRAYLAVIQRNPKAVVEALRS